MPLTLMFEGLDIRGRYLFHLSLLLLIFFFQQLTSLIMYSSPNHVPFLLPIQTA